MAAGDGEFVPTFVERESRASHCDRLGRLAWGPDTGVSLLDGSRVPISSRYARITVPLSGRRT